MWKFHFFYCCCCCRQRCSMLCFCSLSCTLLIYSSSSSSSLLRCTLQLNLHRERVRFFISSVHEHWAYLALHTYCFTIRYMLVAKLTNCIRYVLFLCSCSCSLYWCCWLLLLLLHYLCHTYAMHIVNAPISFINVSNTHSSARAYVFVFV